jgi:hypothetical protein
MPQSVDVTLEVPAELYHQLVGEINQLPKEEQTRLQSNPYPHSKEAQYILEEFLLRRRNIPEHLGYEVEVSDRGEVIVVSEGGLLG